jgi:hypothetical protein
MNVVLVVTIVLLLGVFCISSCSKKDSGPTGPGGGGSSFTMTGNYVSTGQYAGLYSYGFRNYSSSVVTLTITGVNSTVPITNEGSLQTTYHYYEESSKSVSYSPSGSVSYNLLTPGITLFQDK